MTLSEIVKKFELDADPTDSNGVLKALRKRLGELHPDRNGGDFASEESQLNYLNIQSAIESLEPSGTLVPLKEVTALVETFTKAFAPLAGAQEESLRAQRNIIQAHAASRRSLTLAFTAHYSAKARVVERHLDALKMATPDAAYVAMLTA